MELVILWTLPRNRININNVMLLFKFIRSHNTTL